MINYYITDNKYFTLKNDKLIFVNKENKKETIINPLGKSIFIDKNNKVIEFNKDKLINIATKLNYFKPITDEDLLQGIEDFSIRYDFSISDFFNKEERKVFKEWENSVGYDTIKLFPNSSLKVKRYKQNEKFGILKVVKSSQRLLNIIKRNVHSPLEFVIIENYLLRNRDIDIVENDILLLKNLRKTKNKGI